MYNKELFEQEVAIKGYSDRFISDGIGMSYNLFEQKKHGLCEWKRSEIVALCKFMGWGNRKLLAIFYA